MLSHSVPPGREDINEKDLIWVTLVQVGPPDDIIIESLLRSQEIPYRTLRHAISQIPLTVGPYAETIIQVPRRWEAEALKLLEPADEQPEGQAAPDPEDIL